MCLEGAPLSCAPVEGRGEAYLVKTLVKCPGAAILTAFDDCRERAKTNLAEPGFRPGDVPPWIRRQLVEFSLTTVMEDCAKFALEAHGMVSPTGAFSWARCLTHRGRKGARRPVRLTQVSFSSKMRVAATHRFF